MAQHVSSKEAVGTITTGPKIPVFVEEGSVTNPEALPPGYVLIYVKASAPPPYFAPSSVWI